MSKERQPLTGKVRDLKAKAQPRRLGEILKRLESLDRFRVPYKNPITRTPREIEDGYRLGSPEREDA